jgi:hypothetical protein
MTSPTIVFDKDVNTAVSYNSEPVLVSATVSATSAITSADLDINSIGSFTENYRQVSSNEFIIEISCPASGILQLSATES